MNEFELEQLHHLTDLILSNKTNLLSAYHKIQPFLYMMLGEVWCGKSSQQYTYICDSRIDARDACEQFVNILMKEDEPFAQTYHYTSDPIIVASRTGQTFHFIPVEKALLDEYWKNVTVDRVYINTDSLTKQQIDHLHMDVISAGADYI